MYSRRLIIAHLLTFTVTTVFAPAVYAYRTGYAARPGKIVTWGTKQHPKDWPPPGEDFVAISAGECCAIALRADGSVAVAGHRYGFSEDFEKYKGEKFMRINCGVGHWMAQKLDGTLLWGGGSEYGPKANHKVPAELTGKKIIDFCGGGGYSIVIIEDPKVPGQGSMFYWNANGAKGVPRLAGGGPFFNTSDWVTCGSGNKMGGGALRANGEVALFQRNTPGDKTDAIFIDLSASGYGVQALQRDGTLKGWGNAANKPFPAPDASKRFVFVSGGYGFCIYLREDGSVKLNCGDWGDKEGIAKAEARNDVLAVAAGDGWGMAIVAADGKPVRHPRTPIPLVTAWDPVKREPIPKVIPPGKLRDMMDGSAGNPEKETSSPAIEVQKPIKTVDQATKELAENQEITPVVDPAVGSDESSSAPEATTTGGTGMAFWLAALVFLLVLGVSALAVLGVMRSKPNSPPKWPCLSAKRPIDGR